MKEEKLPQPFKKTMSRRSLLKMGAFGMTALTLGAFPAQFVSQASQNGSSSKAVGFGPLLKDPGGVLDLPKGFQYRIVSEEGKKLEDGRPIPGDFDGMAAFTGPGNTVYLVRNHELEGNDRHPLYGKNPYDKQQIGGTTTLLLGPDRRVIREYVSSSGTRRNCAGGATPWGTWLTCEETLTKGHGYVFEVDPTDPENEISRTPIRDMGAFSHEAVDIDPVTGIVYLTEDAGPSFLYRMIPNDRTPRPGALQKGGRLQAAAFEEISVTGGGSFSEGKAVTVVWKDVDPEKPSDDALAKNCIRFERLEGTQFSEGVLWFSDTSAPSLAGKRGRIYRYIPATNQLELFFEADHRKEMEMPDNVTITPWGDLWLVEDGPGGDRVIGLTPEGEVYPFARNRLNNSELAGPTFSPDGKTFFVNIQNPGLTFAIWGPFAKIHKGRKRKMAHALPPAEMAPLLSEEQLYQARKNGWTDLQAAAFHRHGVPL